MKESTSDISAQRPTCSPATISGSQATNSSSSTLASFRSGVSKTSVNKLWTGSEKTPLSSKALWYQCHECAVRRNATPLSCQDSSSRTQRHDPDGAARSRSRHRSAGAPQCSVQVRTHELPGSAVGTGGEQMHGDIMGAWLVTGRLNASARWAIFMKGVTPPQFVTSGSGKVTPPQSM